MSKVIDAIEEDVGGWMQRYEPGCFGDGIDPLMVRSFTSTQDKWERRPDGTYVRRILHAIPHDYFDKPTRFSP